MATQLDRAVVEAIHLLALVAARTIDRAEALAEAAAVRGEHGTIRLELLWQRDQVSDSTHYEAIVHDGSTSVVVRVCPAGGAPWIMQNAQRWADADLLRVNGVNMDIADAIAALDHLWSDERLLRRLIDACIVRRHVLHDTSLEPSEPELQDAVEALRRSYGLYSIAALDAWLKTQCINYRQFEGLAREAAVLDKFRRRVTADAVASYRAAHPEGAELVELATLRTASREFASAVALERPRDLAQFLDAAARGHGTVSFETVRGFDRTPQARLLADSADRDRVVLGPDSDGDTHTVCFVRGRARPAWNPDSIDRLRTVVFADWLLEQRKQASIEWGWGNRDFIDRLDLVGAPRESA